MDGLKALLGDILALPSQVGGFFVNDKITRLRILIVWLLIAIVPSLVIYVTINTYQVNIPGLVIQQNNTGGNFLLSAVAGTSILPILFFFTNGLRGYHEIFNDILDAFFSKFRRKTLVELQDEYGVEKGREKLRKVNLGKHVSGFLLLEFLIIGWATVNYFIFGNNLSGLGFAGYVGDDTLMGAIVFILEGIYCVVDAIIEAPDVYELKLPAVLGGEQEVESK